MANSVDKPGKLFNIDLLRVYAVLSLLIWHCFFCPNLCWRLSEQEFTSPFVHKILYIISALFIPDANMPLFTFISGFVFAYLLSIGHYSDWNIFFSKKSKRLFIPWIILGTVIALTSFEADFAAIGFKYMAYGGGSHLWFLIMLFWLFLVSWIIWHYNLRWLNYILMIVSFFAPVWLGKLEITMLPWGGHKFLLYYVHFAIGMLLFKWHNNSNIKGWHLLVSSLFYLLAIFFLNVIDEDVIKTTLLSFRCIVFDLMLYYFVTWFIEKGYIKENKSVGVISQYSFGIYVFHHWIAWNLYHVEIIIESFKSSYLFYALLYTILIFIVSFYFTKYSLKQ